MGAYALDFLFFHEIGHLVHHHIDYVDRKYNKEITEVYVADSKLESRDFRALELSADSFAIEMSFASCFGQLGNLPRIFESEMRALEAWSLAIGLLFILLDPHPAVRLAHLHLLSLNMAKRHSSITEQNLEKCWKRAYDSMSELAQVVDLKSSVAHVDFESVLKVHGDLLNHFYYHIYPEIEQLKNDAQVL